MVTRSDVHTEIKSFQGAELKDMDPKEAVIVGSGWFQILHQTLQQQGRFLYPFPLLLPGTLVCGKKSAQFLDASSSS